MHYYHCFPAPAHMEAVSDEPASRPYKPEAMVPRCAWNAEEDSSGGSPAEPDASPSPPQRPSHAAGNATRTQNGRHNSAANSNNRVWRAMTPGLTVYPERRLRSLGVECGLIFFIFMSTFYFV